MDKLAKLLQKITKKERQAISKKEKKTLSSIIVGSENDPKNPEFPQKGGLNRKSRPKIQRKSRDIKKM